MLWGVGLFLYELLCVFLSQKSGMFYSIATEIICYGIGYGLICMIGIRIQQMSQKSVCTIMIAFLTVFAVLFFFKCAPTQTEKYPPRIYYLSYAIGMTLLSYLFAKLSVIKQIAERKEVVFISKNSMTLYLVHIILLYFIKIFDIFGKMNFVFKYLFVLFFSCVFTIVYKDLKKHIRNMLCNVSKMDD